MKLRILDNSIRLRLTQHDVATLAETGRAEARTAFGEGQHLVYALESDARAEHLTARFEGGRLTVVVPAAAAAAWAGSDAVSLDGTQPLGDGAALSILVEKDFECLHRRPTGEDDGTFPHPLAGTDAR